MTCTSKAFCEKNPSLCCCIPARKQRTCDELGVCNQVKGCKGCEAQAAPVIYLQTGIEPGDALPLTPKAPLTTRQYITQVIAIVLSCSLVIGALGWLWGTYKEPILYALLTTGFDVILATAKAAMRGLGFMANLLA